MGAVANEDDALVHELLQASALERVDRNPVEFEIVMSDQALDARNYALGLSLQFRVDVPAQLQVDAVDVVRLLVQQC